MTDPIIVNTPGNNPIYITASGVSSTLPGTVGGTQDSLSLYDFLQLVGTNTKENKQATFDSEATTALVNQKYFLGVVEQLTILAEKYKDVSDYAVSVSTLTDDYNSNVTTLNGSINTYNASLGTLNGQIANMNNAIQTINGISSPTPTDIANYNAAVTSYNNYLTSTGNPAIMAYAASADTNYNIPTNFYNTVVIPEINATIDDLGFNIPPQDLLTPSTAPAGANTLSTQSNYSGSTIPLISPSSYSSLSTLNQLPPAKSKTDVINVYFTPYAEAYMANLAATQQKLAEFDETVAAINFFIQQGFTLDPSKPSAFVAEAQRPSVGIGGAESSGSIISLAIGADSPSVMRALSTALFISATASSRVPLPPDVYDQLNALAASLLPRLGLSAGLSVVKLLGDSLKSLPKDSPIVDVAVAAALTEAIIKTVGENSVTKDAVLAILKQVTGLTDEEVQVLADKFIAGQNISLLLFGALQAGLALKNPNLVSDLLKTSENQPIFQPELKPVAKETPISTSLSSQPIVQNINNTVNDTVNEIISDQRNADIRRADIAASNARASQIRQANTSASIQQPASPNPVETTIQSRTFSTINDVLNDQRNSDILKADISANLIRYGNFNSSQASSISNQAIDNARTNLPQNSSQQGLQQVIAQSLINLGVIDAQAQFFALNASLFANLQTVPPTNEQDLSPAELSNRILANIANIRGTDAANTIPKTAIEAWVASLTDTSIPGSWINLMQDQTQKLKAANDASVAVAIEDQRREFVRPTQDLAFFLTGVLLDPANNIVDSYLTGLMYSNGISSKWPQPPLSILA